jgi:hypothetical protein
MEHREIALIELGGSHDECLYSQVLFLKRSGYIIHLIIRQDHYNRLIPYPEVDHWKCVEKPGNWFAEWRLMLDIRAYLRRNNIRNAVFNTAHGNLIRKLSRITGKSTDLTGILHNARKLWTSRTQRIISRRVRKYLVLADFVEQNLRSDTRLDRALAIDHFFPVYFPEQVPTSEKQSSDFLVCIPGPVNYKRRDYISLVEEVRNADLPGSVHFILLGRISGPDGQNLLTRIENGGISGYFTTFNQFVPHDRFYKILSGSNLILPLITPGSDDFDDYQRYKITGAYNLAFGFHIPMLLHESFSGLRIFRETSFFFSTGDMIQKIRNLIADLPALEEKKKNISNLDSFRFEGQLKRYLDLLTH